MGRPPKTDWGKKLVEYRTLEKVLADIWPRVGKQLLRADIPTDIDSALRALCSGPHPVALMDLSPLLNRLNEVLRAIRSPNCPKAQNPAIVRFIAKSVVCGKDLSPRTFDRYLGRANTSYNALKDMAESVENTFNLAIYDLYGRIVNACAGRYHPTLFFGMLEQYGGLATAHRLLKPDADFFSYGFQKLCELGRSDLTMEAMILGLEYRGQLFSAEELRTAQERLAAAQQLYPGNS